MNLKKLISTVLVSALTITAFTIPSLAENNVDPLDRIVDPEKVIIVDAPTQEIREPRLVADYEADFDDLLNQLKQGDSEYQQLIKEAETLTANSKRAKEVANSIASLERNFNDAVESMLQARYTEDKSAIRPEIILSVEQANKNKMIENNSSSDISPLATSVRMGTFTQMHVGDYGNTSKNNIIGNTTDANYSHATNNNLSTLQAFGNALPAWAAVESGVTVTIYSLAGDPTSRTGEMRFYNQTFDGTLYNLGTSDYANANFNVRNHVYNVTTNQMLAQYTYVNESQTGAGNYKEVSQGPHFIYMRNITFTDGHQYRAYVRSFAEGANQGNARANNTGEGLNWETIDIYFN